MQFWPWTLFSFLFSLKSKMYIMMKVTQTHPSFLNHYYTKTVTITQRHVSPDIHILYSTESLRSIIWWNTRKTTYKNNTEISTLYGRHAITFSFPHAETFIVSKLDWKHVKILKFRLDWGLWVLIHSIKIYHN